MNIFLKHLQTLLIPSRPQRRRNRQRGYGSSELLEQRALLSAVAGEFAMAADAPEADANEVDIRNDRRVRIDSDGNVIVTAGKLANDRKADRFVIEAGAPDAAGRPTALIWVKGKLAATISLNPGSETTVIVRGSRDADHINATNAPDGIRIIAEGGAGNDTILGSRNDDLLRGGNGRDYIDGNSGNDVIFGGEDNDELIGDEGNDSITGGGGNDDIGGGRGNDTLDGESGNDTLQGRDGDDVIYGRVGSDVLYGNDGHDALYGSDGDDKLFSGDGNDTARGGSGHDSINGGLGNDLLHGEGGDDEIDGGLGIDELHGGLGRNDVVDEVEGTLVITNDGFTSSRGDQVFADGGFLRSIELRGGSGNDIFDGAAFTDGRLVLIGRDGHDTLIGGSRNDVMHGGDGDDLISGNSGNDTLYGDNGNDALYGRDGDDYLYGGAGTNFLDEPPYPQPNGPSKLTVTTFRNEYIPPPKSFPIPDIYPIPPRNPVGDLEPYLVQLDWTSVTNAARYEIEFTPFNSNSGAVGSPFIVSTTLTQHDHHENLGVGGGYYIRVRAVLNDANYPYSKWSAQGTAS